MPSPQASLNRFALTHQAHGGQLQVVPKDGGGREWMECSRCGSRILAPPERRDDTHEDDATAMWRR